MFNLLNSHSSESGRFHNPMCASSNTLNNILHRVSVVPGFTDGLGARIWRTGLGGPGA